jgi:hypothetical protein
MVYKLGFIKFLIPHLGSGVGGGCQLCFVYAVADDKADAIRVICIVCRKIKINYVEMVGIESYGDH